MMDLKQKRKINESVSFIQHSVDDWQALQVFSSQKMHSEKQTMKANS